MLLAVDAWLDSTVYEAGFKIGQAWETLTIFFRRFRVEGWRRGIVEILERGLHARRGRLRRLADAGHAGLSSKRPATGATRATSP